MQLILMKNINKSPKKIESKSDNNKFVLKQ